MIGKICFSRMTFGLLTVFLGMWGAVLSAQEVEFTREPYLQLGAPTSIHIVWRTMGPTEPTVHYGQDMKNLDRKLHPAQIGRRIFLGKNTLELKGAARDLLKPRYARFPKLHSAAPGTMQYEAQLKGLEPKTKYFYAIYVGDQRMTPEDASYTFTTSPVPGESSSARIWVVGDSGVAREPAFSVHRAMESSVRAEDKPLDLYLHVGDMAYNDGKDHEFQRGFFNVYESTLRNTVCWPAMGNHEGYTSRGKDGTGPYYDAYVLPKRGEAGGLASGTEAYYSFAYGKIHFICLDSYDLDRKPTGAMARWLKADLERTTAEWLIAFWHHPPYTKGSHDSDREKELIEMRKHIMPILEAGGVDLVLTGHSHIYERSMLIDGAYDTPTVAENVVFDDGDGDPAGEGPYRKSEGLEPHSGTIQIVAGHGGANLSRKGTMPIMKRMILEHGSVILDIDGDAMDGMMLNNKGEISDHFRLVKNGKVIQKRLANPKQLAPYDPHEKNGGAKSERVPQNYTPIVPQQSEWKYLAGKHPGKDWKELDYSTDGWKTGNAGFGYGNNKRTKTHLGDMKDRYTAVYLRRAFLIKDATQVERFGLVMDYDDAFIVYLNGKEMARRNVKGEGEKVGSIERSEPRGYRFFPFEDFKKHLRNGRNVLAIEGHNVNKGSSDFLLAPSVLLKPAEKSATAQAP